MGWKTSPFGQALLWLRNFLLDPYYWELSRREFSTLLAGGTTRDSVLDILWAYRGAGFYKILTPDQHRFELETLVARVQALHPRVIVEIGTRGGGTLFAWSQCSKALELLVSIDLPGGIHGGGYPPQRARLYRLFTQNRPQCRLELLRRDSQQAATRDALRAMLAGRPVDFLFIDADHRYAGVARDYALYADLVRPGGLIAFHDIRPNAKDPTIEVYRLWEEIKASGAQVEEIIQQPYKGRYGIGLLRR